MPIEAVVEAEAENGGRNKSKARVRKMRIYSIILLPPKDADSFHHIRISRLRLN